jgi:hypothetical protein
MPSFPRTTLRARQILHAAREAGLITAEDGAQDGSTVEAHASRHRLLNEERWLKRQAVLAEALAADEPGPMPQAPAWMARTRDGRRLQQERYQRLHQRLQELGEANQRPSAQQRFLATRLTKKLDSL